MRRSTAKGRSSDPWVWFDKGVRSRDFIVSEILVALIMLAILAAFWIGALHDWRIGENCC